MKAEDWQKWIKELGLQLLRSSSRYFQPCISLAEDHQYLYRQLFPAAFAACWVELEKKEKVILILSPYYVLTNRIKIYFSSSPPFFHED